MFSQQVKKLSFRNFHAQYSNRFQHNQINLPRQHHNNYFNKSTTTTAQNRSFVSTLFPNKTKSQQQPQQQLNQDHQQSPTTTITTTLQELRQLGPLKYTPPMVIYAFGMREGVWSVSPNKVPEVHVNHHWETSNENRYNNAKKPLEENREQFDQWIESIMRTKGLSGDPSSFTDEQFAIDDKVQNKLNDVLDRIERYQAKPELYVWCREYLKDIFRFSNENGMDQTFRVQLGVDQFKNLIRYKTFIEKERYKMMRRFRTHR
jgi:hypothetical protein